MKSTIIILLSFIGLNAFAEKVELKNLGLDKAPKSPNTVKSDGNGNWATKEQKVGTGNWTVKGSLKDSGEVKSVGTGNWTTKAK